MKKLLIVLFVLISTSVSASTWHVSKIKRIYPQGNGGFVLTFHETPETCTNQSDYFYVSSGSNGMTDEGANKIYSLAIAAATTGKAFKINFNEATPECFINRAFVVY